MQQFIQRALGKVAHDLESKAEKLAYQKLPLFLLELIDRYLRVTVEGEVHIPKTGPAIVVANHSGYMGFDALMLAYHIYLSTGRTPRIIAHKMWFLQPEIAVQAKRFGMIPATFEDARKILEEGEILLLFPEGEEGNFKPTRQRYRLRRFRRGFARLAFATGAPIIPTAVIGAEETHITLSQIRAAKDLIGIIIPVPLNIIPLPAKWKIRFYAPLRYKKNESKVNQIDEATRVSRRVRSLMQEKIHTLLRHRHRIFL